MSDGSDELTFTWSDIERWVKQGLISPYQALGIPQEFESEVNAPMSGKAPGRVWAEHAEKSPSELSTVR